MALLNSVPVLGEGKSQQIEAIGGSVPSPLAAPSGCPFHPRCAYFIKGTCDGQVPERREVGAEHKVSCYLYE